MLRLEGTSAELRVGYQVAARLGSWSLRPAGQQTFRFTATVLSRHDYWSAQRPLDLVFPLGPSEWTWCGVEPSAAPGDAVTIELTTRAAIRPRAVPA